MRRPALLVVTALLGVALAAPTSASTASTASATGSSGATASAAQGGLVLASASTDGARRHARKKKARRTTLRRPARPTASAAGWTNAVHLYWGGVTYATRYRVKWAFAPWDHWPAATRYSAWLPASARSLTRVMTTDAAHDSTMTALPYANPVFTRVQAANGTRIGSWSWWKPVWPRIPTPAAGDKVRFGTYNVMLAGRDSWPVRRAAIARNIAGNRLDVVALQETLSTDGSDVAAELSNLTGHRWLVAPTGQTEGRILYDSSRYDLGGSGILNDHSPSTQPILNYRTHEQIPLPWARLSVAGSNRSFVVVSIHFAPSDIGGTPTAEGNRQTGASARAVLAALGQLTSSSEPAVIAGDFAGGYGRWGDPNPAQPTLVRAGWWDSMASLSRGNVNYGTVNQRTVQKPTFAVAGRADGIFLRGIHGTTAYRNVVNYYQPGTRVPPSDHNLVWSEFQVPGY